VYTTLLLPEAKRDLAALDRPIAQRIAKRLEWLGEHFEEIKPEALTGSQSEFFKFRVGDYRALYKIEPAEKILRVYRIRHRREVYKEK
jgi:mRNA interferase RelE/StbE